MFKNLFVFGCVMSLFSLVWTNLQAEETKNLLKWDFKTINKNGLPAGYKHSKDGKVSVATENGKNVVRISLTKQGRCFLDTKHSLALEKDKKYLFAVQIKIKNMQHVGKEKIYGFITYIYNYANNKHKNMQIRGNGSINEWATLTMIFDTKKMPQLVDGHLLLRAYHISGDIFLKEPYIIELPDGVELQSNLTFKDGTIKIGNLIKL